MMILQAKFNTNFTVSDHSEMPRLWYTWANYNHFGCGHPKWFRKATSPKKGLKFRFRELICPDTHFTSKSMVKHW